MIENESGPVKELSFLPGLTTAQLSERKCAMAICQTTTEKWLPIPGYEGVYEVSDQGRVRSLDRINTDCRGVSRKLRGKVMSPVKTKAGYLDVALQKGNGPKFFLVHRLVLGTFVGAPPAGMVCCHNNGDRCDNRLSNLRWDTSSENSYDVVRHGNHKDANKDRCIRGHLFEGPNLRIQKNGSRLCLACNRAHTHVSRRRELKPQFLEVSNYYYDRIMSGR